MFPLIHSKRHLRILFPVVAFSKSDLYIMFSLPVSIDLCIQV